MKAQSKTMAMLMGMASVFSAAEEIVKSAFAKTAGKVSLNEDPIKREERMAAATIRQNAAYGMKEFALENGNTVWALNTKNAIRKAKNQGTTLFIL